MYPPAKQPVPEDFHLTIAPIDFNRHHPMDWPDHPNEYWVRDLVQGWGKKGANLSAYWYGIKLAEISALPVHHEVGHRCPHPPGGALPREVIGRRFPGGDFARSC